MDTHRNRKRIEIFFHISCEPKENSARTSLMLQETDLLADELPGDISPASTQAANRQLQRIKRSAKVKPVQDTNNKDVKWVDCLARIHASQDKAAFAELFQHFAPRVKGFLMKSGADMSLAEECAQEVMATVWRKAHMFDPSRASAATWIFTIARNRKIDALRKQRRPEPEDLTWGPEAEPDQADVISLQQESALLTDAIAQLPDKQRELIEQAYFGDLSHSEIASNTGLPLGTIKSRLRLALERLRHAMT